VTRICSVCGLEFRITPSRAASAVCCSRKCLSARCLSLANERFDRRVEERPSGCWEWTGACTQGYGTFGVGDRLVRAHRYSYERHRGAIPKGLSLDHLCRNTKCVNPLHLEAVTHQENVRRGRSTLATHCRKGHELRSGDVGHRRCEECNRAWQRSQRRLEYQRRWRREHREAINRRRRERRREDAA